MDRIQLLRDFVRSVGQTPEEQIALFSTMYDMAANRQELAIAYGNFCRDSAKKEKETQKVE